MEDKRITADELLAQLHGDMKVLAERIADAINKAKAGRIIADSEEPVRDAHAVFRQQAFEKALSLLQAKQEAFSPSGPGATEQRAAGDHASDGQRARRHP